ncbi:kynurenine-oxoglutarate transaminase, putative [Ichthyophthirius multifiliis]|uniref:Kynurenine-oxoglutarate transaminase, putative n=1 Tax=Ichthyophthirius multifiliis TaxID=5932 RepID=G0QYP8_ICHMU|nr:kynurenine-oxoglutarate transaminase, putative [Ichthyophthirius multifiliis]EGR29652.1 kynurenine-oxoglutarate transaminase, putative [Ichthyophthirius multifiliis]|eukprot:XP_004030888.1 kynurenine-oxoglutarate transaminase, putative [Ichthyophthirius multifiliis]
MNQTQPRGAKRLNGFDKPTVWSIFSPLSIEYKSINLGQGFPNWSPPDFFLKALEKNTQEGNHQYTRAYGLPYLVKVISDFYKPIFNREIDPQNNICVSAGGVSCLNAIFLGLIDPGDQVILLDPSYDCYRAQIQMAGGIARSVPLLHKRNNTQNSLKQRFEQEKEFRITQDDIWEVDYEKLKNTLNEKTKILLINTPHNPTGKVFTLEEMKKIHEIIKPFEKVIVVEDGVYEHLCFEYESLKLPRFANLDWDRTISVYSAGKLFSATGIRIGWTIGPYELIKYVQSFHQYSIFCQHAPMQESVANALEISMKNNYFEETNQRLKKQRDLILQELVNCSIQLNVWIPQGGFFVIADISNVQLDEKYYFDNDKNIKYTKDYAFCMWLLKEKGITTIPCSAFYDQENIQQGENLVRFAFCKTDDQILEAGIRLNI